MSHTCLSCLIFLINRVISIVLAFLNTCRRCLNARGYRYDQLTSLHMWCLREKVAYKSVLELGHVDRRDDSTARLNRCLEWSCGITILTDLCSWASLVSGLSCSLRLALSAMLQLAMMSLKKRHTAAIAAAFRSSLSFPVLFRFLPATATGSGSGWCEGPASADMMLLRMRMCIV